MSQPTNGLFPASVGVTRVGLETDRESASGLQPCLLTDPRNELLQWNRVLDDQMAISEVFPIVERDLGGGEAEPEQILAAFRALDTGLGLIYASNELSADEMEVFGILYDTRTEQALASIHAVAHSKQPPEGRTPRDQAALWTTDSHALVNSEFKQLVHDCIRDLILQDQQGSIESSKGWTPAGPTRPVEWPPRPFRSGR